MDVTCDYGHFDIVLARICYALNCDLSDSIRYVHPNERNGEKDNG